MRARRDGPRARRPSLPGEQQSCSHVDRERGGAVERQMHGREQQRRADDRDRGTVALEPPVRRRGGTAPLRRRRPERRAAAPMYPAAPRSGRPATRAAAPTPASPTTVTIHGRARATPGDTGTSIDATRIAAKTAVRSPIRVAPDVSRMRRRSSNMPIPARTGSASPTSTRGRAEGAAALTPAPRTPRRRSRADRTARGRSRRTPPSADAARA